MVYKTLKLVRKGQEMRAEEAWRWMWEAAGKEGEVMHNPGRDGGAEEAERDTFSALAGGFFTTITTWEAHRCS